MQYKIFFIKSIGVSNVIYKIATILSQCQLVKLACMLKRLHIWVIAIVNNALCIVRQLLPSILLAWPTWYTSSLSLHLFFWEKFKLKMIFVSKIVMDFINTILITQDVFLAKIITWKHDVDLRMCQFSKQLGWALWLLRLHIAHVIAHSTPRAVSFAKAIQ